MHLYVIARASKDKLDRWVNDVTAQYVPHEYEKGKVGMLQVSVRPIQLLEIVFPEPQLDEVLKIVRPIHNYGGRAISILRKLLGIEKLELKVEDKIFYRIPNADISITPIGIKRDVFINGIEQI